MGDIWSRKICVGFFVGFGVGVTVVFSCVKSYCVCNLLFGMEASGNRCWAFCWDGGWRRRC